jgi:hypothetical protein
MLDLLVSNMEPVRINVRRVALGVLLSLVLPLTIAILLDFSWGLMPLITIGASIFFIPLSSLIVIRATLAELDQVIQQVAPLEVARKDEASVGPDPV